MWDDTKDCPYCRHRDTVKSFANYWEKDGQRGALGTTTEGFIMLLCPKCNREIKWDGNVFLKPDQGAKIGTFFDLIFGWVVIVLIIYVIIKCIF